MVIRATPNSSQPGSHPSYTFYFQWRENGWTLLRKIPLAKPVTLYYYWVINYWSR